MDPLYEVIQVDVTDEINTDEPDQHFVEYEPQQILNKSKKNNHNNNPSRRLSKLYSEVWRKFTIISRANYTAKCNICGAKLSFKTTISNLKKHMTRKHGYDINTSNVVSSKVGCFISNHCMYYYVYY